MLGTLFGVATSLGFGVIQVNAGLNYLFVQNTGMYLSNLFSMTLRDITWYADYSMLSKDAAGFRDSQQQMYGVSFTPIDEVFVYVDYLRGRQHPYIGPNFSTGLAAGGADDTWHNRVNISLGIYF